MVEEIRLATWRVAYRGMIPDTYLDALDITPEREALLRRRTLDGDASSVLALVDGVAVGMATAGACRDEDLVDARELYALYVLPDHWGSGAGSALLEACGPTQVLWVLEANARARDFYARHGFVPDGEAKQFDAGEPLSEIRMVRNLG